MADEDELRPHLTPALSRYFSALGRKGGKKGAITTNAKLTTAMRRKAGRKAADALTPEQRKARAEKAAAARWGKKAGKKKEKNSD